MQVRRLNRSGIHASRGHQVPALLEFLLDEMAVLLSKVVTTIRNQNFASIFRRFRFTFILPFLIVSLSRLFPIMLSIEIFLIVNLSIDSAEVEKNQGYVGTFPLRYTLWGVRWCCPCCQYLQFAAHLSASQMIFRGMIRLLVRPIEASRGPYFEHYILGAEHEIKAIRKKIRKPR